jgi:hypothetical protein
MECTTCPFFRKGRCCHYSTGLRPCTRPVEDGIYQFEFAGNFGLSVETRDWANAIKVVADSFGATYTIRKEGKEANYSKGKRTR